MWTPPSANQMVRREDLPKSLFPVRTIPLSEHDPEALQSLAQRPQRLLPAPTDADAGRQRRLANLAQYRGRTPAGQVKSLGNMPRKIKSSTELVPFMNNSITQPDVPAATPMFTSVEGTLRGKMRRTVLSQDEWDLYVDTWNQFLTAHQDYDKPEDHDDVHTICMETVLMHRIEAYEARNPGKNKRDEYDRSYNRVQVARRNLSARRVDRVGTKANKGVGTINVAVLAGKVTDQIIEQRNNQISAQRQKELDFLSRPKRVDSLALAPSEDNGNVIEGEVVEDNKQGS